MISSHVLDALFGCHTNEHGEVVVEVHVESPQHAAARKRLRAACWEYSRVLVDEVSQSPGLEAALRYAEISLHIASRSLEHPL